MHGSHILVEAEQGDGDVESLESSPKVRGTWRTTGRLIGVAAEAASTIAGAEGRADTLSVIASALMTCFPDRRARNPRSRRNPSSRRGPPASSSNHLRPTSTRRSAAHATAAAPVMALRMAPTPTRPLSRKSYARCRAASSVNTWPTVPAGVRASCAAIASRLVRLRLRAPHHRSSSRPNSAPELPSSCRAPNPTLSSWTAHS